MTDEPEPCCFDEWAGHYAERARKRRLGAVSADLLRGLTIAGLHERTVLDVGCGAGGLLFEALERGAEAATGVDLSSASIEAARRIASDRGLEERASFRVADGARTALGRHDVVVLDKVFCCYADVEALLRNSLAASRSVYGFSTPPSAGVRGAVQRALAAIENAWYRVRRRRFGSFRTHIHDVGMLDARIRAAGFEPAYSRRRPGWEVRVYRRA